MFPKHEICSTQDVFFFAALANTITGTMYTDITGAFPVRSFKSMQYIFVAYVYDLNAIIIRAMPSCTDASIMTAFTEVITTIKTGGYCLALNVMDNECSVAVEKYIRSEKINIQLVPPHNHRANAAERTIPTLQEHVIAALATVDMHCLLQLVTLHPTPAEKPTKLPACTKQPSYLLPIVEPDDDRNEMPTTRSSTRPRHSTRLITNRHPLQ